jgi:polyisoprenoid-binding protein YceI
VILTVLNSYNSSEAATLGFRETGIVGMNIPMWRLALLGLIYAAPVNGQPRAIDAGKSVMTIHVYKTGMLSAFAHDHEISAPVAGGTVDIGGRKVALHVDAGTLRVQDAKVSGKDRGEIQANMLGADVLDAEQYKEIQFRSTSAESSGAGDWKVNGELTLHGQTRPISMEVHEKDGHYAGTCRFDITNFGIKPVKAAGGAVRVKNEVRIDFDIQLVR